MIFQFPIKSLTKHVQLFVMIQRPFFRQKMIVKHIDNNTRKMVVFWHQPMFGLPEHRMKIRKTVNRPMQQHTYLNIGMKPLIIFSTNAVAHKIPEDRKSSCRERVE